MIISRYEDFSGYDMYHGMAFIAVAGFVAVACMIPFILYLVSMQKALSRCAPENRGIEPGLVWLNLIPMLNLVWNFIVVLKVGESLDAEVQSRGIAGIERNPGRAVGLAYCVLTAFTALFGWIPYIGTVITFLPAIAALVCWIVFWVKVSGVSSRLA